MKDGESPGGEFNMEYVLDKLAHTNTQKTPDAAIKLALPPGQTPFVRQDASKS
jgi:hypothetical protein